MTDYDDWQQPNTLSNQTPAAVPYNCIFSSKIISLQLINNQGKKGMYPGSWDVIATRNATGGSGTVTHRHILSGGLLSWPQVLLLIYHCACDSIQLCQSLSLLAEEGLHRGGTFHWKAERNELSFFIYSASRVVQVKLARPGLSALESSPASQSGKKTFFLVKEDYSFHAAACGSRIDPWARFYLQRKKTNVRTGDSEAGTGSFPPWWDLSDGIAPSITAEIVWAPGNCLEQLQVLQQIAPAYQISSIYHSKRNNPVGFSLAYQDHHHAVVMLLIWFLRWPPLRWAALCRVAAARDAFVWLQVYNS